MPAPSDFVEFTVTYRQQGQTLQNIIHYRCEVDDSIAAPITPEQALGVLNENVLLLTRPYLVNDCEFVSLAMQNLTNEDEFADIPLGYTGTDTQNPLPPFVALGLTKFVATKRTRPGSIRLPGMAENDIANGAWNNFDKSDNLIILYSLLLDGIPNLNGGQNALVPIVLGRTRQGAYDLTRYNPITSFGNPRITSQVSRKVGRGI